MNLQPDLAALYRKLQLIRRSEEEIARLYPSDKIRSPVHLSIGQESVAVGVCDPLRPDDVVSGSYRSHAAYIAKGGNLGAMFAELYGKDTGCARGKGGSMHLIAMDQFVMGSSAVVGTTIPVAAGYALALKATGTDRVVAAFFGDGAVEEGVFYESLNFSALHRLPLLFVCENNGYAIHTPISKRWATRRLCERVETFGVPARKIPDGNVVEIWNAASDAYQRIRSGSGPQFLECDTYRWKEHVGPGDDYDAGYRTRDELRPWAENDQVKAIANQLDAAVVARINASVENEVADAIRFAETSPFPEAHELATHVYA